MLKTSHGARVKREHAADAGFTLVEAMVAVVIIAGVVMAQASLLVLGAKAQTRLTAQRAASSVLQNEIENLQAAPWDDLMMTPATIVQNGGRIPLCNIGGNDLRSSAQIVRPSSVLREEGVTFLVTREVVWTSTDDTVTCDATPNDRADTKTITVSVTWNSEGQENTREGSVIVSRYRMNAPTAPVNPLGR